MKIQLIIILKNINTTVNNSWSENKIVHNMNFEDNQQYNTKINNNNNKIITMMIHGSEDNVNLNINKTTNIKTNTFMNEDTVNFNRKKHINNTTVNNSWSEK